MILIVVVPALMKLTMKMVTVPVMISVKVSRSTYLSVRMNSSLAYSTCIIIIGIYGDSFLSVGIVLTI